MGAPVRPHRPHMPKSASELKQFAVVFLTRQYSGSSGDARNFHFGAISQRVWRPMSPMESRDEATAGVSGEVSPQKL